MVAVYDQQRAEGGEVTGQYAGYSTGPRGKKWGSSHERKSRAWAHRSKTAQAVARGTDGGAVMQLRPQPGERGWWLGTRTVAANTMRSRATGHRSEFSIPTVGLVERRNSGPREESRMKPRFRTLAPG